MEQRCAKCVQRLCRLPDAWVTTWDSHNPGVLALVRKRGEETLWWDCSILTEYPAGASLDALGGEYHTRRALSRLAGGCGTGAPSGTRCW